MPSPSALAVSAPVRLRERLAAAPDGPRRVVHRGSHAVYVDLDGWCVGLVASGAARIPCALRSREPRLSEVPTGPTYLHAGVLHLDGTPLVVGRVEDVRVGRLDPTTVVECAAAALTSGPLDGIDGIDAETAARLVGRGEGLTPLGDDVLCGWLALHRAAEVATPEVDAAVRSRLTHTTLLSATLLDCALHGEALPEFTAYVAALGTPVEAEAARALVAIGHTSGAGLMHGANLALSTLHETHGAAA